MAKGKNSGSGWGVFLGTFALTGLALAGAAALDAAFPTPRKAWKVQGNISRNFTWNFYFKDRTAAVRFAEKYLSSGKVVKETTTTSYDFFGRKEITTKTVIEDSKSLVEYVDVPKDVKIWGSFTECESWLKSHYYC